jgi:hypothetical protein
MAKKPKGFKPMKAPVVIKEAMPPQAKGFGPPPVIKTNKKLGGK